MLDHESEETRLSAEEAEVAANDQPIAKESREIARPDDLRKSQDQVRYGPAPLLPFESEARYKKIEDWLKPGFGGYQSGFEDHLRKEMVDSVWRQQRWDHAIAGSTNRVARQLVELAAASPSNDVESLSIAQLIQLPAPRELSVKLQSPPPLRAAALVMNKPARTLFQKRIELEDKRFAATNELVLLLRERRALLFAMDHYNGLAKVRVPNSIYEPDAEKITPDRRRREQLQQRLKNRIIFADRNKGWTTDGFDNFGADIHLRGESSWAFANLYLDIEEYFGIDWPPEALIAFRLAKHSWEIRRLNEASHQFLLMKYEENARKYVTSHISFPGNEFGATSPLEHNGTLLVQELQAAGSSPSLVLAEVLQKHAQTFDDFDEEIDCAFKTRLDYARLLTRLRGKKLTTERHHIQGASYRNRGEHQSF